jgi:hypothetical protein
MEKLQGSTVNATQEATLPNLLVIHLDAAPLGGELPQFMWGAEDMMEAFPSLDLEPFKDAAGGATIMLSSMASVRL